MASVHYQEGKTLYLFGDQAFPLQPHLKNLSQRTSSASSDSFLHNVLRQGYDTIKSQWIRLPHEDGNALFPYMTSLEALLSWRHDRTRRHDYCIPLDMSLTCLLQIANFVLCHEEEKTWVPRDNDQIAALGFCTGGLAAAAVSCSSTLDDLIPLALEAVRAAFMTGVVVGKASLSAAEDGDDRNQPWATGVLGLHAAETVEAFCEQQENFPLSKKPYISAYTPRGVTVSGPPRSIAQLRAAPAFRGFEFKEVPVEALYHAPHLYSPEDVARILEGMDMNLTGRDCKITFVSGTGNVQGSNFKALLEGAVRDILLEPLRWPATVETVQAWSGESLRLISPSVPVEGFDSEPSPHILQILAVCSKAGAALVKQIGSHCSLVEVPGEGKDKIQPSGCRCPIPRKSS